MATQIKHVATLETVTCGCCGILHAIPQEIEQESRRNGRSWYCPNGHYIGYSDTEVKRLQAELDKQKIQLSQKEADARFWRDRNAALEEDKERAERSLAATKGVVTKLRKRVGQGVCPCCNRTFSALARHMKTKHPGYHAGD
jgi:hypothetical protein